MGVDGPDYQMDCVVRCAVSRQQQLFCNATRDHKQAAVCARMYALMLMLLVADTGEMNWKHSKFV